MVALFMDFVIIIGCIVGVIINFNKDWSHVAIFITLAIHSGFHFGSHFRKKFINRIDG